MSHDGFDDHIIDLYDRHAHAWAADRGDRINVEKHWLDRFVAPLAPGNTVLDLGCGSGQPIARYLIERQLRVVGVDSSASMISMCRAHFPEHEWIVADMRSLALGRRFDAVLAWDSLFHLSQEHQRRMFAVFERHCSKGAALMFTSGPRAGEAIGRYRDEPLFHASLDPAEYRALLTTHGFDVLAHLANDPECGGHTIWLARASGA